MTDEEKSDDLSSKISRFHSLKKRNVEAVRSNNRAVIEEDRLKKLPRNYEFKAERLLRKQETAKRKLEAEKAGIEFERVQNMDYTVEECERWDRRKCRKGLILDDERKIDFVDFTRQQYKKYTNKNRTSIDMEQYELMKAKMPESEFYPSNSRSSLFYTNHQPKEEDVDRLVSELNKQSARRIKSLVRRREMVGCGNGGGDIDYINEKNRLFNETVERFYGKYTQEIKQNLERGTAV